LSPEIYAKLMKEGASVTKDLTIASNAAQVAVVVRDANTGAMGTVRIPMADYFAEKPDTH
jgi:hypothetical protein